MAQVTTPLLKFVAELVLNRSQRLIFDSSSPNGILLFREVSKLIVCYGSRVLALPSHVDIASKYKGMWISFTILSRGTFFEQLPFYFYFCFVYQILSHNSLLSCMGFFLGSFYMLCPFFGQKIAESSSKSLHKELTYPTRTVFVNNLVCTVFYFLKQNIF